MRFPDAATSDAGPPAVIADKGGPLKLLALVAFVLALLFWGVGDLPLFDLDEGAFTEATREMLASGNYVSTYLNAEPRHDKPILIYWAQALSVSTFGLNEFAFRLPSIVATGLWAIFLYRFVREQVGEPDALVATLTMTTCLTVVVVGRAAIADGLLNLLLALTLFDIYRHSTTLSKGSLWRAFLWMGLGWLTKGPVAVVIPFVVSGLAYGLSGQWKIWFKAAFNPVGWIIFLAVTVPWHVLSYLDQGWAFFDGFYLGHNLQRYTDVKHGHSGGWFYYLVAAPLIFLPFSGWFLRLLPELKRDWQEPLRRFLWLWFLTVLTIFSFSTTQLPHYLLYGATPVFVLMAVHRDALQQRWLALLPAALFLLLLTLLPELLQIAAQWTTRPYDRALVDAGSEAFGWDLRVVAGAGLVLAISLIFWRRVQAWQGLLAVGVLQSLIIVGWVLPGVAAVMQQPVKEAATIAREVGLKTVAYRTNMPSFSVYRNEVTESRLPRKGELAFMRIDRLERLRKEPEMAGLDIRLLFRRNAVVLVKVE